MRISDWSSDVCSSDLYNQPEPYPEKSDQEWGPYVICLQFVRHGIEPRPVLDDPCGCDVGRSAPTRTKEGFRIRVVPHDGLGEDCWPLDSGGKEPRSEEHTSELQSLMRSSHAVFCLKKKNKQQRHSSHK